MFKLNLKIALRNLWRNKFITAINVGGLAIALAAFILVAMYFAYETSFDKRNFSRKVISTKLLIKQRDKDKAGSKKGAFYYKLNARNYKANFQAFLNIIPNSHLL